MRNCGTRIHGASPGDIATTDLIGPATFLGLSDAPLMAEDSFQAAPDGGLPPLKFVTEISGQAVGPVVVSIAERDRAGARLIYDPAEWHGNIALEDGDHTVVFEVCAGENSQYNGGFIVAGPRCVTVQVVDQGLGGDPIEVRIPFGVEDCA